jgi:DNA-binding NarL/FixJ family response regulator
MDVSGEAGDGRTACQQAGLLQPDVVVMDVSMPDVSGAEATAQLHREYPHIKVLALTVHEHKGYLHQLLEAGASGYVLKRAGATELIHAIRTVAAGGVYLDPSLAGQVVRSFVRRPSGKGVADGGELSDREVEVLRLVAAGYSTKEIAGQLALSPKTVETYKARSMEKLGLQSRAEVVRYALQRGWLQAP